MSIYFVTIPLEYRYLLFTYVGMMRRLRLGSLTSDNTSFILRLYVIRIQNVLTFRFYMLVDLKAVYYFTFRWHLLLDFLKNRLRHFTKDFTSRRAITLYRLVGNRGITNQRRRVQDVHMEIPLIYLFMHNLSISR